ncbi:copine-8-like, partial [Limulus polyphemus]|uniref:Copine-8-like n=1 Tax=Limulus polyphemus TaxID=6850 RepID=A0ABM1TMS1_LIMPO
CINKKKKAKKKSYKNSGVVKLISIQIEEEQTFLDYIAGGTQINFTVAIDFTASNGDPRQPNSLHYRDPQRPNAYTLAIKAVGEIIQDYDSDKMFPALGFGARLPPDGRVSHEFFLVMYYISVLFISHKGFISSKILYSYDFIFMMGVCCRLVACKSVWQMDKKAAKLCGEHVARFAAAFQEGSHYFILLIITDGVISDMPQTKQAIVQAASLPMSIIIVGVGPADFAAMEELDGDEVRISSHGHFAERDIVQFVPFREFLSGSSWITNQARLAKEVLAEIPDQFIEYMKKRGIKAKLPPQASASPPPTFSSIAGSSSTT